MKTLEDLIIVNDGEYLVVLLDGLMAHVKYVTDVKSLENESNNLNGDKEKSVALLLHARLVVTPHLKLLKETKEGLELRWCQSCSFMQLLCQFALIEQLSQDIAEIILVREAIKATLDLSEMVKNIDGAIVEAVAELTPPPNAVVH